MPHIKVNHIKYYYNYYEVSKRPTLVFINSLGSDLRIWNKVLKHLQENYSVLVFDKPGHGRSGSLRIPYSIRRYADDLLALINYLSIDMINLIGISIGGQIAMRFAINYPNRVSKLIISNTGLKIGTDALWQNRIKKLKTEGLTVNSRQLIGRWFSSKFIINHSDCFEFSRKMIEAVDLNSYLYACKALMNEDITPDIKKMKMITLCVGASADISTPPDIQKKIAGYHTKFVYKEIESAGHLSCIEQPDMYAQLIHEFINDH